VIADRKYLTVTSLREGRLHPKLSEEEISHLEVQVLHFSPLADYESPRRKVSPETFRGGNIALRGPEIPHFSPDYPTLDLSVILKEISSALVDFSGLPDACSKRDP